MPERILCVAMMPLDEENGPASRTRLLASVLRLASFATPLPASLPACLPACLPVLLALFLAAPLTSGLAQSVEHETSAETYDVDPSTGFRMERYRAPVPASVPGGVTLDTPAMLDQLEKGDPVLFDVFPPKGLGADPIDGQWVISEGHETLPGATWLPEVGRGHLSTEHEAYFRRNLDRLTGGDLSRDIVFFCTADCWQSWNAAKRAIDWGYSAVHWYATGTDGWAEAGGTLIEAHPLNFLDDTLASVFPEDARLFLVDADGGETAIGSVRFAVNDDGSALIDVVVEGENFSDHFLNMYPFKCLADAPEWFCYLPYPYELDNTVGPDDLTDLEYQLLFVRKAASEFGIDTWNGVYYKLSPLAEGGFEGALFDGDLTVLQAPPDDPDTRPLDLTEFFDDEAARRRFPRLLIRPSGSSR